MSQPVTPPTDNAPADLPTLPHGIREAYPPGFFEQHGLTLGLGVLATLALIGLGLWLYHRWRRPQLPTGREIALRQLQEARTQMQALPDAVFCERASRAMRGFIEHHYAIAAPEMTTEEFLNAARENPQLDKEALVTLSRFLQLCDLAKFARHGLEQEDKTALLDNAAAFIEQAVKPEESPVSPQASARQACD